MTSLMDSSTKLNGGGKTDYHAINMDETSDTSQLHYPFKSRNHKVTRLINRGNGRSTVVRAGVKTRYFGFLSDGFTTLINSPWWVIILVFAATYIISWLFFGAVWRIVAFADDSYNNGTCVDGVTDFSSALLLSIETQVTIGFGNVQVARDCPWGIFFLMGQSLIGLFIDSVILGLIFAKITRPRNRRKTIVFSRQAIIYEEGGQRYFEVRIADLRQSQIVEAHVRLQLYWYELVDPMEERYEFNQRDLDCGYDTGTDRIILITPVRIRHRIHEDSPLYNLNSTKLSTMDLEVVVILEGIVEPTGLTAQALYSYTSEDIIFNRKFAPVVSKRGGKWEVDFSRIDATLPCPPSTDPNTSDA
jgi:hypothetical protein